MVDELVLYTNPQSRGRVARWMLEEVGQTADIPPHEAMYEKCQCELVLQCDTIAG